MIVKILIYILFIAINILLAYQNNYVRLKRIKERNTKQIEHTLYGLAYLIICLIPVFILGYSTHWFLLGSLLLLHISIFPVMFNSFAGTSSFNLSKTSTAFTDKLMVKIGLKNTEDVNIIAALISIIFLLFNK